MFRSETLEHIDDTIAKKNNKEKDSTHRDERGANHGKRNRLAKPSTSRSHLTTS